MFKAKYKTIWKRERDTEGGYTFIVEFQVSVPAEEGDQYTHQTEKYGSVSIQSYSRGLRGGAIIKDSSA